MEHSPIPNQLCSWNPEGAHAEPLEHDLDRLFRASPKLADACKALLEVAREGRRVIEPSMAGYGVRHFDDAIRQGDAALALLED